MSLIRQVWLLVLGTIVFALVGCMATSLWTAHRYLETQLALKNSDNAQSLALTLSQQGGDAGMIDLVISAQFDIGHYASIRLIDINGKVLSDRRAEAVETSVPAWFRRGVSIKAAPGLAQVSSGWSALGQVEVVSQPEFAYAELWRGAWSTVLWMLLVGAAAALIAHLAVRRLRVPLDAAVAQAHALTQRRYLSIAEPRTPELRDMIRAMNLMVERVRAQFSEQATLVEELRLRANGDALTGLSHRTHFMAGLEAQLTQEDPPVPGQLLLIRVRHLAELNQRQGHHATDGMLRALASRIEAVAQTRGLHLAGRLNGSDFAVLFRENGALEPLAQALMASVQDELSRHADMAAVLSAVHVQPGDALAAVMASADAGLARAEARGDFAVELVEHPDTLAQAGGQAIWREAIGSALREGRIRLSEFRVVDRHGLQVHAECPLRLQMLPSEDYRVAANWLPYAMRTGQMPDVDLAAVDLTLRAIAADGRARCVNVSPLSLRESGFLPGLLARLLHTPELAHRLWIDVDAAIVERHAADLIELTRQVRPLGVRVGLEHANERVPTRAALFEWGIDYVKLAPTLSKAIATQPGRVSLLKGIVSVLHGLGVSVYAEGVQEAADLARCWDCGVDAATGPAV